MFTIDLLKGRGLPQKSDAVKKIMQGAGIVFPLLLLVFAAGAWGYDHVQLKIHEKEIRENEAMISRYGEEVTAYRQSLAHIEQLRKQFEQVTDALYCRVQLSELFDELVEQLPSEIFFYEIKLDRTTNKERFQAEGSSEVKQRTVIRRSLTLVLCDYNTPGGDRLVQDYIAELKKSELISSLFKEIKPAASQQGMVEDRQATYYYIDCELQERMI